MQAEAGLFRLNASRLTELMHGDEPLLSQVAPTNTLSSPSQLSSLESPISPSRLGGIYACSPQSHRADDQH